MIKIHNTSDCLCWQGCRIKGILTHCWRECTLVQPLWKSVWWFDRKLEIYLPQDPTISLMDMFPKDASSYQLGTHSTASIPVIFIIVRYEKQPRYPSTEERMKKIRNIYTMVYYSNSQRLKPQAQFRHRSAQGSLHTDLAFCWVCSWDSHVCEWVGLILVSSLGMFFSLPFICLVQFQYEGFVVVLFCFSSLLSLRLFFFF